MISSSICDLHSNLRCRVPHHHQPLAHLQAATDFWIGANMTRMMVFAWARSVTWDNNAIWSHKQNLTIVPSTTNIVPHPSTQGSQLPISILTTRYKATNSLSLNPFQLLCFHIIQVHKDGNDMGMFISFSPLVSGPANIWQISVVFPDLASGTDGSMALDTALTGMREFLLLHSSISRVSPQQEIPFHHRLTFSNMSILTYLEVLLF